MPYLFDTNHWIIILKGKDLALNQRVHHTHPSQIVFCSVVKAELFHGANKYENRKERLSKLTTLYSRHQSYAFDDLAAEAYGDLRHDLETKGSIIGPHDLMIASIALVHRLIVVTNNSGEFSRVNGLQVEDWTSGHVR